MNKLGYFSIIKTKKVREELPYQITRFSRTFVHAVRKSVYAKEGPSMQDALKQKWFNGKKALSEEGISVANKFKKRF